MKPCPERSFSARVVMAIAVASAIPFQQVSWASADGHPTIRHSKTHGRFTDTQDIQGTPAENIRYEAIVLHTKTPKEYNDVIDWLNLQMDKADERKFPYEVVDLTREAAMSDHQWREILERVKERARQEADQAGNVIEKVVDQLKGRSRHAAVELARNQEIYRSTFAIVRFMVNGTTSSLIFYKATGSLPAAMAAGYTMGGMSGSIQYWIAQYNKHFLLWQDPLSKALEKRALAKASENRLEPLTDEEIIEITGDISRYGANVKWAATELFFIIVPQMILKAFGYDQLGSPRRAVWSISRTLAAAFFAQASWDTGNAEKKKLDLLRAHTEDDRLMFDLLESSRSMGVSMATVAGEAMSMTKVPLLKLIGYSIMITVGIGGYYFRKKVQKDLAEERLRHADEEHEERRHLPAP